MNHLSTRELPIAGMRLPRDFSRRVLEPHVLIRARNIETNGMLHEPIVRKKRGMWDPVTGLDRIASHIVLKRDKVMCKVYEMTDIEAKRLRQDENIHRRWDKSERDELIRERLHQYIDEEELVGFTKSELARTKGGALTAPKTRAIQRLADELGMAPGTLRAMEVKWRSKPKEPLATLGMELDKEFYRKVAAASRLVDKAAKNIHQAEAALTLAAHSLGIMFPKEHLQFLRHQLYQQSCEVEKLRPVSLCPWCKGLDGLMEDCMACEGAGFITKGYEIEAPPELLDEQEPKVVVDGEFTPVEDVAL